MPFIRTFRFRARASPRISMNMTETNVSTALPSVNDETKSEHYVFGPWTITAIKSHILQSNCTQPNQCNDDARCTVCRYGSELLLPQTPDMVFGNNILQIRHTIGGFGIEFNALDALKMVNHTDDIMKVAISEAWKQARADKEYIKEVLKPFDWTFTTRYKGTLIGENMLTVSETEERIDVDKLRQKEKIMYYDDVHLFEDELADNGCALMSAKIRIMPTSFFILQRFYLRVDSVLVRIHDTRVYHEVGTDYLLREFSVRESSTTDLQAVPLSILTDPNEVWMHLKLKEEFLEKLDLPK